MTFGEKLSRLGGRLKDPEWRRYGKLLIGGKMLGTRHVLLIMLAVRIAPEVFSSGSVVAQEATPAAAAPADAAATPPDPYLAVKGGDAVNPINTTWVLVAAFLVFGMQVGFTMLEAGFCRSRETVNVLMECVVDTCLCGLLLLRVGLCIHVRSRDGHHRQGCRGWHDLVLPAKCAGHLRRDGRRVPRRLDFPVCVCRYLLDDHVGCHDRPHGLDRRLAL